MKEIRVQDKAIQAGRNKKELAIYLDKSIISLMDLAIGKPVVLTADKEKQQIIIKF